MVLDKRNGFGTIAPLLSARVGWQEGSTRLLRVMLGVN